MKTRRRRSRRREGSHDDRRPTRWFAYRPERARYGSDLPVDPVRALVEDLATTLAAEGIPIRGAFRRPRANVAMRSRIPAPPETGALVIARFEIPLTSNEGEPFTRDTLVTLLRELYLETRGATFFNVVGVWEASDGAFCGDVLISVEVWLRDRTWLNAFVARVVRDLQQEELTLRYSWADFVTVINNAGSP